MTGAFLVIDLAFFGANVIKIQHGGWFPLLVAGVIYAVMTTWHTGRQLVAKRLGESEIPLSVFFASVAANPPVRVPGTAVFMTARPEGAPPILVHHLKHNKVLHEQIVLLTVSIVDVPTVDPATAIEVSKLQNGFYRVIARFGFMEPPDVPAALDARAKGASAGDPADTTYLPRAPDAVRARAPGHDGVARQAVHLPVAQRAARHEFLPDPGRSRRGNRHPARDLR